MMVATEIIDSFQMTDIGLLPEDWQVVRLGNCCKLLGGYPFKSEEFRQKGILVVKIGSLQNGTLVANNKTSYYDPKNITEMIKKCTLKSGDILIALTGATTGKIALVPEGFQGSLLNQRVGKFEFDNSLMENLFGKFYFATKSFQTGVKENILQSAQGNVSPKQVENLKIPLPPLPEQKRIAFILSALQGAKEKTEDVLSALKELKKSMMRHLFTYGAVPIEEIGSVKLKETEIGQMPGHWEAIRMGDVCEKPEYGLTASAVDKNTSIKFLRITDIQDGRVNWELMPYCNCTEKEFQKNELMAGDIVIARIGATTGKTYLIKDCPKAVYASYLIRVRPIKDLLPDYLYQFTNTETYWKQINETKGGRLKQGVNIPVLQNLLLPFPPIAEQKAITDYFTAIDSKIDAEENKKNSLDALFKTLLSLLMTGKMRVNHLEI